MKLKQLGWAVIVGLPLAVLSNGAAFANNNKQAGSGPNPFRDCGIGAALFSNTAWAAVTSNVIWDIGTTAVTSATASPETCQGTSVQVAEFVANTRVALLDETAQGSGVHLSTMLDLYACDGAARGDVVSSIRSAVADSVSNPGFSSLNTGEQAEAYFLAVDDVVRDRHSAVCAI